MESVLEVKQAGIGSTIQAKALRGYRDLGLCSAGPLDVWNLQRANLLVGNQKFQPCIEILLGPVSFITTLNCLVAIVGYGFRVEVNNKEQPINHTLFLNSGDKLSITHKNNSGVAYMALRGGLKNETSPQQDRGLEKDDTLCQESTVESFSFSSPKGVRLESASRNILTMAGPEHELIPAEVVDLFWQSDWRIEPSRNRMGVRLARADQSDGEIKLPSMASHAVLPGTIQMTTTDSCIALSADCQTTGGYPRVATVISAEIWKLAQLPTGTLIRFIPCDINRARKELHKKHYEINRLEIASHLNASL